MTRRLFILPILLSSLLVGCISNDVKPWQRDLLAKDKMQLVADPMEQYFDDHIYFSKEASSGGQGVGGGGCGCN
jgi:hypothetical protein